MLAHQANRVLLASRKAFLENLHRDVGSTVSVGRAIHLGVAALADELD